MGNKKESKKSWTVRQKIGQDDIAVARFIDFNLARAFVNHCCGSGAYKITMAGEPLFKKQEDSKDGKQG